MSYKINMLANVGLPLLPSYQPSKYVAKETYVYVHYVSKFHPRLRVRSH